MDSLKFQLRNRKKYIENHRFLVVNCNHCDITAIQQHLLSWVQSNVAFPGDQKPQKQHTFQTHTTEFSEKTHFKTQEIAHLSARNLTNSMKLFFILFMTERGGNSKFMNALSVQLEYLTKSQKNIAIILRYNPPRFSFLTNLSEKAAKNKLLFNVGEKGVDITQQSLVDGVHNLFATDSINEIQKALDELTSEFSPGEVFSVVNEFRCTCSIENCATQLDHISTPTLKVSRTHVIERVASLLSVNCQNECMTKWTYWKRKKHQTSMGTSCEQVTHKKSFANRVFKRQKVDRKSSASDFDMAQRMSLNKDKYLSGQPFNECFECTEKSEVFSFVGSFQFGNGLSTVNARSPMSQMPQQ
jgi:hypothetical protein